MKFTHLHTHSHYSLLDGLAKIPDLVAKAKKEGMEALALTDHGAMYGAVEFFQQCKKNASLSQHHNHQNQQQSHNKSHHISHPPHQQPIIGVETYLAPNGG